MKLNQKLKELKRNVEIAETIEETADGNAIIDIAVNSVDDFYSPYSPSGYRLLNPEMVNYIEEFTTGVPKKQGFTFRISAKSIDEQDKKRLETSIRRTYAERIAKINEELKRNLMNSIIFLAIGLIFLAGVIIANANQWSFTLSEVLDIISWVFVWESVDTFFMERYKKKVEKIKCVKLAVAEITFI